MAERDIIGGIFTALGAGLAGAAGQEDQFLRLMEQMREQGRSEDQKKIDFGKIRLAALGYDVSNINSEEDLVAEQSRIERQGAEYDRASSQFNEMVEAQEGMTAQWREQETPVEPGQIAGWEQGLGRLQNLRQKIERNAPPGSDTSNFDYMISRLQTGYGEAVALSDARSAGGLAEQGKWGDLAATWVGTDPNTRTRREMGRNPYVKSAFDSAAQAHQALNGMRQDAAGKFIGPGYAASLRQDLSDADGNLLPWSGIQGDPQKLARILQAGADPQFSVGIRDAETAFEADIQETQTRDLLGGFGLELPEGDFRNAQGGFDSVRFYRDTFDKATANMESMDISALARLAVNMKSVSQAGGPESAVVANKLQEVNEVLLARFEGDPDGVARAQEAQEADRTAAFENFLAESEDEDRALLSFDEAFPEGVQDYYLQGPEGLDFFRRAPKNRQERERLIQEMSTKMSRGEGLPPRQWDFMQRLAAMTPQDRERFIATGKPPEFDTGRAKALFVQGVMPPEVQADFGALRGKLETTAGLLRSAGMETAADAADQDAAYYREQEYGREVGARGLRTAGLALAEYAEGGSEALVNRIAGDFPASAQQDLTGATAEERVGLTNLEEELARAEGTGETALILLRNVENGIYNAAGLQFGTEGERTVARAEAQITFGRIREQIQTLIDYQEENGLSDEEMAKRFGGKGADWTSPLFEALGEASLGL